MLWEKSIKSHSYFPFGLWPQRQSVFVISSANGALIRELVTGDANHSAALAWSPHNPVNLAVGTAGFKIKIVDVSTGKLWDVDLN